MKPSRQPLPKPGAVKVPSNLPHPARNLGPHLKRPASGEIVTEHRWTDRKGTP